MKILLNMDPIKPRAANSTFKSGTVDATIL
jgi:hypothetical protein